MPSRRPPSQRDPAYALHRLAGTVGQILPGVKVKNASPAPKTRLDRIAAVAATGGDPAPLGYIALSPTFTMPTSNGSAASITAWSDLWGTPDGTPDVGVSGGSLEFAVSGTPAVYVLTLYVAFSATTNAVSSDVHYIEFADVLTSPPRATGVLVGTGAGSFSSTRVSKLTGSSGSGASSVTIKCTGGTNRVYTRDDMWLEIIRFALPT